MRKLSLDALAREHLDRAATSSTRRSADTVYGGHEHTLRQTVLALLAGVTLAELGVGDAFLPGMTALLTILTPAVRYVIETDLDLTSALRKRK